MSQYEDMSKKYGLGFLLSSGSSGVAFKDGTKIALDSGGHVFEYVDRVKGGGSKRSNSSEQITSREPSTTTTESSAAAAAAALARRRSRHYGGEDSRSGSGGELQQQKQSQKQQRWLEELPRIVHSLDDYPDRFVKKVVIAQKIRKLLQRAAIAEEDSAAGSTVSATSPVGGASPRDVAAAATAAARSRVDVGGGSAADDGGVPGGAAVVERVQKARGGSATPFIFVEDWKRTRSSWIFRLSNRTVQVRSRVRDHRRGIRSCALYPLPDRTRVLTICPTSFLFKRRAYDSHFFHPVLPCANPENKNCVNDPFVRLLLPLLFLDALDLTPHGDLLYIPAAHSSQRKVHARVRCTLFPRAPTVGSSFRRFSSTRPRSC